MAMYGLLARYVLADGTALVKSNMRGVEVPLSIDVQPVAGDTVTVSLSFDNGATYPWTFATAVQDQITVNAPVTAIKMQRTAGAGTTSVVSMC